MTKIALFGATGKTGRAFIEMVKNNSNYQVKALIRKNTFEEKFQNFDFIIGDILNIEDVLKVVKDVDCVISLIGHNKNSPANLQTLATKNIIECMKANNISRIISLSGTGIRIENDKPSLIDKILNFAIKKIDPDRIKDGIEHFNLLKNTDLNWTILRVLKLTSQNKINKYKLIEGGPAKILISRKTVVKVILELLENEIWIKKMPVVSGD